MTERTGEGRFEASARMHLTSLITYSVFRACTEAHGLLQNNEQQSIERIIIYPTEYFCPLNFQNGKTSITDHTFSIHWYDASWFSADRQYELRLKWKLNKMMPEKPAYYLARTIALMKYHGFRWVYCYSKRYCEDMLNIVTDTLGA